MEGLGIEKGTAQENISTRTTVSEYQLLQGELLESARAPMKAQVKSHTNDECTNPGNSIQA
jgi:hypothetical protein